jgi:hypothetical protein
MEYYKLLYTLCRNESISEICIISKSNYNTLSSIEKRDLDPRGVIKDLYTIKPDINKLFIRKPNSTDEILKEKFNSLGLIYEITNDVFKNCDFALGFTSQGYSTSNCIPYLLTTVKAPFTRAKTLNMSYYYTAPIIYFLNKTNIPWLLIATDPRYIKPKIHFRDTVNIPKEIIGQHNFDIEWKHITEFKELCDTSITENIKSIYSGVEKINLINENVIDPSYNKDIKFTIISLQLSSESATKDLRFSILKEWILDLDINNEISIYGKWSEYFKKGYPQFKGYASLKKLDHIIKNTRYSLVLPTSAGWVTSKYAELLQLGVLPFLHPKYDSQYNIVDKDHFIRVTSPKDMYDKMNYLDNNPDERIKIVRQLQNDLIKDCKSGEFMYKIINNSLERCKLPFKLNETALTFKFNKLI